MHGFPWDRHKPFITYWKCEQNTIFFCVASFCPYGISILLEIEAITFSSMFFFLSCVLFDRCSIDVSRCRTFRSISLCLFIEIVFWHTLTRKKRLVFCCTYIHIFENFNYILYSIYIFCHCIRLDDISWWQPIKKFGLWKEIKTLLIESLKNVKLKSILITITAKKKTKGEEKKELYDWNVSHFYPMGDVKRNKSVWNSYIFWAYTRSICSDS